MPEMKSKSRSKKAPAASTPESSVVAESKPASAGGQKMSVTHEERYHMIAEAAYFRAEKRGFIGGDTANDWLEAEAEIDRILQKPLEHGKGSLMSAKQAFQQKLDAQLKEWDTKLDELKTKAQEATAELRTDYEKQLEILAEKREAAQAKLQELRLRTEDAWEDLKGGTERAWDEMRKALDRIASRFK